MAARKSGPPVPADPPDPPPELMRYLTLLYQSGTLPPLPVQTPPSPTASPTPTPTPTPTEARSFSRPGRGKGGALAEKEKVSKQITAPATKRKSLVDPDTKIQPSTSGTVSRGTGAGSAKRRKGVKVMCSFKILRQRLTKLQSRAIVKVVRNYRPQRYHLHLRPHNLSDS